MGIKCEISLFQPPGTIYLPGQAVSGVIRYELDKPTDIQMITTSLKGRGDLKIEITRYKYTDVHKCKEMYADIQGTVHDVKGKLPAASYEVKFNFILPYNIPSTTVIKRHLADSYISGKIKYFIVIHFDLPGLFSFNKKFMKEILVFSKGIATLSMEPVIYEEEKRLIRFFSKKHCSVTLKATVSQSVIPIGGIINVKYEIENNSNIQVKCIETKLMEVYDFKIKRLYKHFSKSLPSTKWQTGSVNCEETQVTPLEIRVPSDIHTLDYSKIITRHYTLMIVAVLPIPHRNIVIDIPIQIGSVYENISEYRTEQEISLENPPSYWEIMGEMPKDGDDSNSNIGYSEKM